MKASRELWQYSAVSAPETPYGVAEVVVPFAPTDGKSAELVPVYAEIPRFGNEFRSAQLRVLLDGLEKRSVRREAGLLIKGKAVLVLEGIMRI